MNELENKIKIIFAKDVELELRKADIDGKKITLELVLDILDNLTKDL